MTRAANLLLAVMLSACSADRVPQPRADIPSTTNDESNDQALGSRGNTLCVSTPHNGRQYRLDAAVDVDSGTVSEIYFPKGGNVDLHECVLDADMTGECEDENGKTWEFSGKCAGSGVRGSID